MGYRERGIRTGYFQIPALLMLALIIVSCSPDSPAVPDSLIRLYPTGKLMPLFECTTEEADRLSADGNPGTEEAFYRINAGDVSRPGWILPIPGRRSEHVQLKSPDRLEFSICAAGEDGGAVLLKVSVIGPGDTPLSREFQIVQYPWMAVEWRDFELALTEIDPGQAEIRFECVRPPGMKGGSQPGYVLIGSPRVIPRLNASSQPNIVMLVLDTLRTDRIGCWGSPESTTPNLDRISRRSDLFLSLTAASSWTKPSMNAIMTGLYPHRNKLVGAPFSQFDGEITLLAEILAKEGFATLGISSNMLVTPISEYDRGFDRFDTRPVSGAETNSTAAMQNAILGALRGTYEKPFFLFAHIMDPHARYVPPEPFNRMFKDPTGATETIRETVRQGNIAELEKELETGGVGAVTPSENEYLHALYKGEIRYMDSILKSVIDASLKASPDRECIFFLLSDHGEGFMEHGTLNHGKDLYCESVHVPWLVFSKASADHPRLLDLTVSHVDVLPTLCGYLHLPIACDGIDALAPGADPGRIVYSFLSNPRDLGPLWRAAVGGNRKVIRKPDGMTHSYDLDADPAELSPVSCNPADPMAADIERLLTEESKRKGNDYKNPGKVVEQLKMLGYVH